MHRLSQNQSEKRLQPADCGLMRVRLSLQRVRHFGILDEEGFQVD